MLVGESGLGLGLTIASENAKLIDANITLESEKGKGATFFVSIPYKISDSENEVNPEHTKAIDLLKNINDLKILIAEDDDVNYLFLETLLKRILGNDKTIFHAQNGNETIECCKNNPDIDLVFMDIKLPLLNGYEATQNIKEIRPAVPVIAQTAYATKKEEVKAFKAGCDGFISKPILQEELISVLIKHLVVKTPSDK
jgi:CheY-like chemotaxis protein